MAKVKVSTSSRTFTLNVSQDSDGNLVMSQEQQLTRMGLNDRIRWIGERGLQFWIVFEDRTPLDKHALGPLDAANEQKPLLTGPFKYHVVLDSDRTVRLDPVVVVDPPPPDPYVRDGDDG